MIGEHITTEIKLGATAEENVYAGVYKVLLGGMAVSTILFALGILLALLHPRWIPLTPEWVRSYYHFTTTIHGLAALDPMALLLVATALLILTPVVRVLTSIVAFAVDHDHKYVFVTSLVFGVMIVTVILGLLGLS